MAKQNGKITKETFSYLVDVFNEICHAEGGESFAVIDGKTKPNRH